MTAHRDSFDGKPMMNECQKELIAAVKKYCVPEGLNLGEAIGVLDIVKCDLLFQNRLPPDIIKKYLL